MEHIKLIILREHKEVEEIDDIRDSMGTISEGQDVGFPEQWSIQGAAVSAVRGNALRECDTGYMNIEPPGLDLPD